MVRKHIVGFLKTASEVRKAQFRGDFRVCEKHIENYRRNKISEKEMDVICEAPARVMCRYIGIPKYVDQKNALSILLEFEQCKDIILAE